MKYTLDDKMDFGKYAGKTLKEVADLDPKYLYICHKENPEFRIHEDCAIYCFKKLNETATQA